MGEARRRQQAPTEFAALLASLGVPAPWTPGLAHVGEGNIFAVNGRHVMAVDPHLTMGVGTVGGIVEAVCEVVNERAGGKSS